MTTISHDPTRVASENHGWRDVLVPEMWASLAIIVMWLAVLFDAIYGPDIVTTSAGGDQSVVPSAVALGLFAFFATWVVAKYGFRRNCHE
ncbi:MAG TPA: hypothetical protein VFW80_06740 [Gaiellaceae bacterium]|nr:hypothetical protein [Gaiellaceae bacterium]